MYDPHTRESRGFGFVTMETPQGADEAIATLNGSELHGKTMSIEKVYIVIFVLLSLSKRIPTSQARRGRARTPTPGRYYGPPKRYDSA